MADIDDEDEVDILGDFSANIETGVDINEFPTQGSLLGDDLRHPWLLDHSQVLYFDQTISVNHDDRQRSALDLMLQEEKKHFQPPQVGPSPEISKEKSPPGVSSKLSPVWTKQDIASLKSGISIHGKNWSKIARLIGTKTTLQVKSFLRNHPELSVTPTSSRPASPNFPKPSSFLFESADLIEEAAIPASIEEVIATVTSGQPTVKSRKIKPYSSVKPNPKAKLKPKMSLLNKVAPKKRKTVTAPPLLPRQPLITGEIVRLRKESAESSTESDVDIDIDEEDEKLVAPPSAPPTGISKELKEEIEMKEPVEFDMVLDLEVPEITEEIELTGNEEEELNEDIGLNNLNQENVSVEIDRKEMEEEKMVKIKQEITQSNGREPKAEKLTIEEGGEQVKEQTAEPITFPEPLVERCIDPSVISEEERQVHKDFFAGNSVKTPDRYLRIRNSILEQWKLHKPKYMTKTSVRPALKHCGDVNLIGRIHCYLEQTGAINFGCSETQYGKPIIFRAPKERSQSSQSEPKSVPKLEIPRARKSKFAEHGTEGYTVAHDKQEDASSLKRTKKRKRMKPARMEDPFRLVPCLPFSPEQPAPFEVRLSANALVLMDVHSHLCKTEIIGLLGGQYDAEARQLYITVAQPCRSLATSHQCEMCPISQTQACDALQKKGLSVVGWYHSHPTFMPRPSVRDLETQAKFQDWFARNEAPFVGIIVSPYYIPQQRDSWASVIRCLTALKAKDGEDGSEEHLVPYKFEMQMDWELFDTPSLKEGLRDVEKQMQGCPTLLPLDEIFRERQNVTYTDKVLKSLARHLTGVSPFQLLECFALVKDFLLQLAPGKKD